jgi:BA14K-like protein
MLKNIASIGAALILAAAAFSGSAQAQRNAAARQAGPGVSARAGGGAHFRGGRSGGGTHFSGARRGGTPFAGARSGGAHFRAPHYAGRSYGYRGRGWAGLGYGAVLGGLLLAPYALGPGYYSYYYDELPPDDAVAYCIQRFKSYDLRTGTYLGFDGYRHPCP